MGCCQKPSAYQVPKASATVIAREAADANVAGAKEGAVTAQKSEFTEQTEARNDQTPSVAVVQTDGESDSGHSSEARDNVPELRVKGNGKGNAKGTRCTAQVPPSPSAAPNGPTVSSTSESARGSALPLPSQTPAPPRAQAIVMTASAPVITADCEDGPETEENEPAMLKGFEDVRSREAAAALAAKTNFLKHPLGSLRPIRPHSREDHDFEPADQRRRDFGERGEEEDDERNFLTNVEDTHVDVQILDDDLVFRH
eukprot:TRINITY_DN56042_c0_g1_i1.p1 TRINITY_DN56042_c0_g1~~TRINITY_DN56042_c0_g1_i1.p1  ORF type:complete len:256 (-),score=53.22 TRINITY_DN56042_c0_g1_i1:65-832(-)